MAVTDAAIEKIKGMILSGELKPGSRLPPEKELGERLGLSRNSLREAVKALEVVRVLDVRRGDGTYVTSLEPDLLLEVMSFVVDLHHDDSVLDLFTVRRLLEPAAAAMATARLEAPALEQLAQMVESVDAEAGLDELVAHDLEFHHRINAACGNSYLTSLLDSLSSETLRARVWRGLTQENAVARTLAEHRAIVAALADGDAELVRALAVAHVVGVEQWLRRAAVS
ncbi:MAG TPA: FCD domain-containing protein [Actinomycetaceae bacterium]|nr:FCD domain-containing protein [Actinomycetaceae bacterium]